MSAAPPARALLDALDEPALIVAAGRIEAANRAALAMLGPGIVGRDHRIGLRHPQLLATIAAGKRADVAIVGVGGPERPWLVAVRPLGQRGGCLIRFIDRAEALAAERMRVDFVANASHELRTPLATISGYAETLAEPEIPDQLRRNFATTIAGEAARMLRIIEDLMSLSRIEASRFVAPGDRCNLVSLARQAEAQVGPLAERRNCPVETDLPAEPVTVAADCGQMLQVIDNLLSNAIRYGGSGVRLTVATERGRPFVRVSDSGPGIAPLHLPRLTERFYRIDDARSRGSGGTGLGLAIVKHIVERHRGTLDIRSRPGEGTSVTVALPAADLS
ncbi:sensor histidine kinase [Sphingomonas mesophila]|uniref:sensor histidine kinase n=1 Tax=Sphingomonas mesophila TaxID=2303576 RepID=UPI000E5890D2|nr:ATP-binding protein [Sphingomonas mesophila]